MRYDPRTQPVLGRVVDGRPCYLPSRDVAALVEAGGWRSVWRVGTQVTTVETWGHAMVRPWDSWGDVRDLEIGIAWWTARQMRAPSSPSGLVRDAAPQWFLPATWTSYGWALPYLRGGWQEAQVSATRRGLRIL